jgi:hypothetical protein
MDTSHDAYPILQTPGVSRNVALSKEASWHLNKGITMLPETVID